MPFSCSGLRPWLMTHHPSDIRPLFKVDNTDFFTNFDHSGMDGPRSEIGLLKVDAFGPQNHELCLPYLLAD